MKSELKLAGTEKAKIIARDGHSISRKDIAPNALKVLYRLTSAGYHAYIVGVGITSMAILMKTLCAEILQLTLFTTQPTVLECWTFVLE